MFKDVLFQRGSQSASTFADFADFAERSVPKLNLEKTSIFIFELEGPAEGRPAELCMQILQSMLRNLTHARLPLRGCGEYLTGYALSRRPLTNAHCCTIADSCAQI